MKRVTRLTFVVLIAATSLPAFAAGGPVSFWDEIWAAITGRTPTVHADDGTTDCKAHPHDCSVGFQ